MQNDSNDKIGSKKEGATQAFSAATTPDTVKQQPEDSNDTAKKDLDEKLDHSDYTDV